MSEGVSIIEDAEARINAAGDGFGGLVARVVQADDRTPPDRLPYPGLRAFKRNETDLFFGRIDSIDPMVDRLAATRFLAVLGASGSGKSSLVRGGLLDALDTGLHPKASALWRVADMRPGSQPIERLAIALLQTCQEEEPDEVAVEVMVSFLRRGPRAIIEWANAGHLPPKWNLLILVDQFEELFRYRDYAKREDRDAFLALLIQSSLEPDARISVTITMRSEYLAACAIVPALSKRIAEGLFLAARMNRDEFRQAILGPASVVGFKVQPELTNRLLDDLDSLAPWQRAASDDEAEQLAGEADQLPLMQHALNRLWRQATAEHRTGLTLDDYRAISGVRGALDSHGAEVLEKLRAKLGSDADASVEKVFRALVGGPSLALAIRRPLTMSTLTVETGLSPEHLGAIVGAFSAVDCGFLVVSESDDSRDDPIVDIGHESLIRQWSALSRWFERESRKGANWIRLVQSASSKSSADYAPLSNQALVFYEAWWREQQPVAGWATRYGGEFAATKSFLDESLLAEGRRRQRRNWLVVALAVLSGIVIVGAPGAYFWWMREQNQASSELAITVATGEDFAKNMCEAYLKQNNETIEQCSTRVFNQIDPPNSKSQQLVTVGSLGTTGCSVASACK